MELREFASRVLFGTTLQEKLDSVPVHRITDDQPGPAIAAPDAPGRPSELRFKKPRREALGDKTGSAEHAGSEFARDRIEHERDRAQLLHAFANHELLATELMALVLLRFPEAPAAFRRGVLQTLLDEQEHTRLYLERLRACGVEFGQLPVSGYFWRAIAGMENPIDYVAGLSLTFEQANLDFARHFARRFAEAGDDPSARLLDKVHRDEIAHVAYGLKWFRRWKNPSESDWTAFCRQLRYPLSPQRAKGFSMNIEGRRAAGFDAEFIAELNVYAQSKGRTPRVFVFNPFAEGFVARGRAFSPNERQTQLARDLANLPQFLCRQDDVVLVPARPSVEFLTGIQQAGFDLPEFVELGERPRAVLEQLARRKLGGMRPWAWSPDSAELLAPLAGPADTSGISTGLRGDALFKYDARHSPLYSKSWSAALLATILEEHRSNPPGWLCPPEVVGTAVNDMSGATAAIDRIRRRGWHRVVAKEALGLAGGNAIRLWEPSILEAQQRWMRNVFERGGELVIEPWLERECDFSIQLECDGAGLKVVGHTGLLNDERGQFLANLAAPNHRRHPPSEVLARLGTSGAHAGTVREFYEGVFARMAHELRRVGFRGPLGIDVFVYRADDGRSRLKPVVEINPRYTMGRLTIELMKQVCPGSHGQFRLVNLPGLRREGFGDFKSFAGELRQRHPIRIEGQPVGRIREGVVCLNDPVAARSCLALFQVSLSGSGPVRTSRSRQPA